MFEYSSLNEVLKAVPFGIFVLDASGTPVYSNPRADEILGNGVPPTATPDTLARSYDAFLAGTDTPYPTDRMPIVRALAGETSTVDDMEIRGEDGVTLLEVTGAPVFDKAQRVKYAVAVFNDITAARAVETALRRLADELAAVADDRAHQLELLNRNGEHVDATIASDDRILRDRLCAHCAVRNELERERERAALARRALKLFIANFTHEVRTPLNHIIGFSDLIESSIQNGATHAVDNYAETIRRSGVSLLDTLNRLIAAVGVETGATELSLQILEVEPLLGEVASRFAPLAEQNGNRLELVFDQGLGCVQTDPARLGIALEQIVHNACKHCRDGVITVTASRKGEGTTASIEVVVSDTGCGIDPKRGDRLIRGDVDPGHSHHDAVLGIGIPLAVRSLKALGGAMSFATEPGAGTRFNITFPTYTRPDRSMRSANLD